MAQEQASRHANVSLHSAYMPEPFGTHHSKMLILLRHDDSAQVVIHTANMIARDWTNMTQGLWRSPLLPRLPSSSSPSSSSAAPPQPTTSPAASSQRRRSPPKMGSGERFKQDFLAYLAAYAPTTPGGTPRPNWWGGSLVTSLAGYDFSGVRGALVASVPGRHPAAVEDGERTLWGWAALRRALRDVPVRAGKGAGEWAAGSLGGGKSNAGEGGAGGSGSSRSEIVAQVSSIATLGPTDAWLRGTFFEALSTGAELESVGGGEDKSRQKQVPRRSTPHFRVVFPTPPEIRNSLDGYAAGASIHTKIASAQQAKQLEYLRPLFCRWENDLPLPVSQQIMGSAKRATSQELEVARDGGRNRAAPHIKTYIRYHYEVIERSNDASSSETADRTEQVRVSLDWALLTSANISRQAWGEAASSGAKKGKGSNQASLEPETLRVSSWEIGVLVWPDLFAGEEGGTRGVAMVPTFRTDLPEKDVVKDGAESADSVRVGLRVPYSLPLQRYGPGEIPWVASASHEQPDWKGQVWTG